MADIRKTFNFRDGVQVDDEVLVVRGNRVGLGTTSPDQLLDVRGNANITGVTSTVNFNVTGVGTFNQVKVGNNIILDATSGVMTATTFKGDGSSLSNIPTSQWVDVNLGAGVTSIYNDGSVGVGTTNPANPFQVGGNPNNGIGVGISTSGNIKASGIITATTFSGSFSGDLTGNVVGDVTGTATTATLANTATLAVNAQGLTGNPSVSVTNVNASGVGTFPTLVTTDLNTVTLKGYNSLRAPHGTTTTIVVTVAAKVSGQHRYHGSGSANGFVLDGVQAPYLTLTPGRTYRFDVSDGTNAGHPLRFFYDVDKTTPYTTGVTASGNAGVSGSYVDLVVSDTTPSVLHYQCQTHDKMGNSVQTGSNILDTEHDSTVRGTFTATTFSGNLTGTAVTSTTFFGNLTGTAVTATTFTGALVGGVTGNVQGNLTGNVTGNVTGLINSVGVSTITRLSTTNISATGVSTFTDIDISGTADLPNVYTSGIGTFTRSFATNLNVSGVSTFGNNIVANGNLDLAGNIDVDGMTELDDVNVSSAATIFTAQISRLNISGITTSTGGFVGNLTGNATGTSGGLSGTPNIVVNNLKTSGITTVGVLTATSIGIGTDSANANLQIHNASGASSIVVGQNSAVADNNLQLRYGGGASAYSTSDSVDLINYGDGNLNSFITGTSNFNWLKGNSNILMSLTDSGNLGIGKTDPTDRLHVQGNARITGVTTFTGNVTMSNLTVPILNIADVSANLIGNVNSAGISTFRLMHISGTGNGIGVGGTASGNFINAGNTPLNTTFVGSGTTNTSRIFSREGALGVGTDRFTNVGGGSVPSLEVRGATMIHGGFFKVGGKSSPVTAQNARSLVDFSDTINTHDATTSFAPLAYMVVPRGTTAQRNALRDGTNNSATLMTGSMFYDTDLNKLCVYDNGGWKGVTLGAL
tara:strand:+ start:5813 stop:8584 length:2772 start_codon:yes stop_codon:yes gene_type:complete